PIRCGSYPCAAALRSQSPHRVGGPFVIRQSRLVLAAPLLLVAAAAPFAAAATPGFAFLNLGAGARAAAMGDAHVAVPGDAAALYWNPASLSHTDGNQVSLTHLEWFQDFRLESAALAARLPFADLGVMMTGLYTGQNDLVRRDSVGTDEG